MIYSLKYKLKGQLFWRKISKVKGDFIPSDIPSGVRVAILEDESRIEIPLDGTRFFFSKERFIAIKKEMEKEVGHKISTKVDKF